MRELNQDLLLWAKRKYKKLRRHHRRAARWIACISRRAPELFAHWQMGCGVAPRWVLYELRGSCTVLREPRGESPRGYSLILGFQHQSQATVFDVVNFVQTRLRHEVNFV